MLTPDNRPAKLTTYTTCPDCKCTEVRQFSFSNKHCNGDWNESLRLDCGLSFEYSPNFSASRQTSICTRNKQYHAQRDADKKYQQKLISMIKRTKMISEPARAAFLKAISDNVYIHY